MAIGKIMSHACLFSPHVVMLLLFYDNKCTTVFCYCCSLFVLVGNKMTQWLLVSSRCRIPNDGFTLFCTCVSLMSTIPLILYFLHSRHLAVLVYDIIVCAASLFCHADTLLSYCCQVWASCALAPVVSNLGLILRGVCVCVCLRVCVCRLLVQPGQEEREERLVRQPYFILLSPLISSELLSLHPFPSANPYTLPVAGEPIKMLWCRLNMGPTTDHSFFQQPTALLIQAWASRFMKFMKIVQRTRRKTKLPNQNVFPGLMPLEQVILSFINLITTGF